MIEHSKLPWHFGNDAQGPAAIFREDGMAIALFTDVHEPKKGFVPIESPGAPERTANAKLFFAAPWLLLLARCFADEWELTPWSQQNGYILHDNHGQHIADWPGSLTDAPESVQRAVEAALGEQP